MIGTTISHYKVISELGRGGMGIVYKAEDAKLSRIVALKVLSPHMMGSEDDRARFYREARAAAALHHPNIATVFEIDEHDDAPFIAMEFIDGPSLDEYIARGPLELEKAVGIATQIAGALGDAHAKGIVHRDVKASNIMLSSKGDAKVLDFGLALTAASTKLTRMGSTLGTFAYMSPEQASGAEVDRRTDLWALGVVLYEMVVGRNPFGGDYEQAVVYNILNAEPEPLTAVRTGVPMELERVVAKLLRKEADHRYQTAEDLIADLKTLQLGKSAIRSGPMSRSSIAADAATPDDVGRTRVWWWLTGILVVASILAGALSMQLLNRPEKEPRRFHISPTEGLVDARIAPDGSGVAWMKADALFFRSFGSPNAIRLSQTSDYRWMAWSPDSRSIALVDGREITNVRVDGSGTSPIGLLPPSERVQGVAWTPAGRIFVGIQYGGANGEIFEFPASGGEATSYMTLSTAAGTFSINDLAWLPGPEVLIGSTRDFTLDQIRVINPQSDADKALSDALISATRTAVWMQSIAYDPRGYILYERGGDLWRLPISPDTGMPLEEPTVLFGQWTGPSVSADGSLLAHDFGSPFTEVRAKLFDAERGTTRNLGVSLEGRVMYPVFHPDGDRLIVASPEGAKLVSLERGDSQRISDNFAVISQWVNDRVLIVSDYGSLGNANILQLDPTARSEPSVLIASDESEFYGEVSPDGSTFLYYVVNDQTGRDLWTVPVASTNDGLTVTGEPSVWFAGPNDDAAPTWHPSGDWVAYMSNETGRFRVYVRSWPDGLTTEIVSSGEGMTPLWSIDGGSLFYRDSDSLYVVTVRNEGRLRFRSPRALLSLQDAGMVLSTPLERPLAVRPNTGELLYFQSNAPEVVPRLILVENWLAGQ